MGPKWSVFVSMWVGGITQIAYSSYIQIDSFLLNTSMKKYSKFESFEYFSALILSFFTYT